MNNIPYYEELMPEEQAELTELIRLLFRQTFILERKYDRRSGRYQYNKDFRFCSKHLEFIHEYLKVGGIEITENSQLGVIYIQGENQMGEKLPRLATLYILILKLIYDEQMASVSNSVHIITTLSEMNDRLGNNLGLLTKNPAQTEIRRAVSLLKKYQIIEPLDMMEGMDPQSRMIIYPTINAVLFGEDVRGLLSSFADDSFEAAAEQEKDADKDEGQDAVWRQVIEVMQEVGSDLISDLAEQEEGGDADDQSKI